MMRTRPAASLLLACVAAIPTLALAQDSWVGGRVVPGPGLQPNEPSYDVAVSANGQVMAFASDATNWYAGGETRTKIMVLDMVTGLLDNAARTNGGIAINGILPALSRNGRYVAFANYASALDVGVPTSGWQVLRKDRWTGELRLASANAAGQAATGSAAGQARDVSMSGDGRWIAFRSDAGNLTAPSGGEYNIFVKDLGTGAIETVSTTVTGAMTAYNDIVPGHAMSGDGRFVVFSSPAANLVAGQPATGTARVYLRDRATGMTEVVSRNTAGDLANSQSDSGAISPNGRFVSFRSFATNLDGGNIRRVYVRDRVAGTTVPMPVPFNFHGCDDSDVSDAGTVIYNCFGTPGQQVFLHVPGAPGTPFLLSANGADQPGNGMSGATLALDASGLSMAFESLASDLDPSDTNGYSDVFVLVSTSTLERVFSDGFGD